MTPEVMDSAASVDSGAPQGGSSSELLDSLFDTPGSDDTGTEQEAEGDGPGQLAEGEVDPLADVFGEEDPIVSFDEQLHGQHIFQFFFQSNKLRELTQLP